MSLAETMMSAGREVLWAGQGVKVKEAPTSADAIRLAGLDWKNVLLEWKNVAG